MRVICGSLAIGKPKHWRGTCSIKFRAVPAAHCLDPAVHSDFLLIQQIAHWTEPDVEAFRAQYVNRLKSTIFSLFRSGGKQPPNREPARCVCDRRRQQSGAGRRGHGQNQHHGRACGIFDSQRAGQTRSNSHVGICKQGGARNAGTLGRARGCKRHCRQHLPQTGHGHHRVSRKRTALDLAAGRRRRVIEKACRAVVRGDAGEAELQTIGSRLFRLLPVSSGQPL